MPDLDSLVKQRRLWDLRWRDLASTRDDSIVQALEERGYHVQLTEEVKAESLAGVAELQGAFPRLQSIAGRSSKRHGHTPERRQPR